MVAFSYYGNKIRAEFQDQSYVEQKYVHFGLSSANSTQDKLTVLMVFTRFEIGVGVFVGWGGSTLLVVGGLIYSIFAGREGCRSRYDPKIYWSFTRTENYYLFLIGNLQPKETPGLPVPCCLHGCSVQEERRVDSSYRKESEDRDHLH